MDRAPAERRVLVVHPSPDLYGSDRVMLSTVQSLVRRGCRVAVSLPRPGPLVPLVEAAGAEVVICASPVLRKSALRTSGLLRLAAATVRGVVPGVRLLRRWRPDVVYVSTLTIPLWLVLARVTGRAAVCHVHEAETAAAAPVRRALAAPLLAASSVVANSAFSLGVLVASWPRLARRSRVVPNPVPGPPAVVPARPRLTGAVRLLYVGRLSPRKGGQVAVAGLARLRDRGVDARLVLVGSVFPGYEPFEAALRAQVAEEGLADRVTFAGFRADVWPALAEADVVVVPSLADEPFGNTAVEAVLAGRPVVASAAGGLREAVAGYRCAVVVPPGDAGALADGVEQVIAAWPRFRAAARDDAAVAARRHAPDRYGDRLAGVLDGSARRG